MTSDFSLQGYEVSSHFGILRALDFWKLHLFLMRNGAPSQTRLRQSNTGLRGNCAKKHEDEKEEEEGKEKKKKKRSKSNNQNNKKKKS